MGGYFARASDLGIYRLLVDGRELGAAVDFHNEQGGWGATHVVPTGEIVFGELDLAAGEHELVLECAGKGARSTGRYLAVDGFMLKPVEKS